SNLDCFPSLMVPRNTVWSARVKDQLMINCTVVSEPNCWNNIAVSWCKIDMKNEYRSLYHTSTGWRTISESKRVFFLIFWEISLQDSGLYRCKILSPAPSVSHAINVTVTDSSVPSLNPSGAVGGKTLNEGHDRLRRDEKTSRNTARV
ncbi:uncharacterized protein LOC113657158 isoform X4, partial [Tachysurus ichikawai]